MAVLAWDASTKHLFETGVDRGVLYPMNSSGVYQLGVVWNGLISVTEKPSGAEPTPMYADNIKYLNLMSAEEFGATIEAYTYPTEFAVCDGSVKPVAQPGLSIGQQTRRGFGLCYRTKIGNEVVGDALGYKLHIIYNCLAAPSEKAYSTINETPEAITFSWELTTTPVAITGYKPSACLIVNSTKVAALKLAALEKLLYGGSEVGETSQLPTPAVVISTLT
jgi:hypothetical protein